MTGGRNPSRSVRRATEADIPALAEIFTESWRDAYTGMMPDAIIESLDAGRRRAQLERLFAGDMGRQALMVAIDGDTPVGLAWVGPERCEPPDPEAGELYAIYVLASHWGRGYGFALMEAAKAELRELGFRRACLWVLDGNERAEAFYRRQGWERTSDLKLEEWGSFQIQEARYVFRALGR